MGFYSDSKFTIGPALERLHTEEFESFAAAGTWLTGEERTAVARQARYARCEAGVQEAAEGEAQSPADDVLPRSILDVVTQIAVAPKAIERAFFEQAMAGDISDAEYVETVGIVARLANLDVFARGIGVPMRPLGAPIDGEPSFERPDTAVNEGAWVASVPSDESGGNAAKAVYGGGMMPFIYRALSLAPAEASRVIEGGNQQYLPLDKFFDFNYSHHPALSRPQVEIVAARVSAFNECFY
jgi:hypothetical protein